MVKIACLCFFFFLLAENFRCSVRGDTVASVTAVLVVVLFMSMVSMEDKKIKEVFLN